MNTEEIKKERKKPPTKQEAIQLISWLHSFIKQKNLLTICFTGPFLTCAEILLNCIYTSAFTTQIETQQNINTNAKEKYDKLST